MMGRLNIYQRANLPLESLESLSLNQKSPGVDKNVKRQSQTSGTVKVKTHHLSRQCVGTVESGGFEPATFWTQVRFLNHKRKEQEEEETRGNVWK